MDASSSYQLFFGKPSQLRKVLTSVEEVIPFSLLPPPTKEEEKKEKKKRYDQHVNLSLKLKKQIQRFGKSGVFWGFSVCFY